MSSRKIWLTACILVSLILSACSKQDNKQPAAPASSGPPTDVVSASSQVVELTAGNSADAFVTVRIKAGYHINGNPATKYQIETALNVEPTGGITAGETVYPPSETKQFSFSPDPIMVYEGEVVIKQNLRADAGAEKGSRSLRGRLKVQPCDDTVCYPPRTMDVPIPVNVK